MSSTAPSATNTPPRDSDRVRGLLVVNPYSSGMTSRRERAIVSTLRERMDVEVRRTERPGHAPRIVAEPGLLDRVDVVIACGGDGTANEVLNGMSLGAGTAAERPDFAIIPAGGTNVLARSVGLPNHPVRAVDRIVDAIVHRRARAISLGMVDERLFMFSAGVGIDAEVVKRMEERRSGRRPSDAAVLTSLVGLYASSRFAMEESMTIRVDGADAEQDLRSAFVIVGNTTPFTYMGRFPVHFTPDCDLTSGLDFFAPRHANVLFAMRQSARALGMGRRKLATDPGAQLHHDVDRFSVTCDEPMSVQADGEYLGERTHIEFATLRDAVRLVG
jgi:diacylglycerol kinase family enzyme